MPSLRAKTPTINRIFVTLVAATALSAPARADGAPWSADDAVRHALANPALAALLDAAERTASADAAGATLLPTPAVELSHEQLLGGRDRRGFDFSAQLRQTFDVSGWRSHLRAALPLHVAALRADADAQRVDLAAAVRLAFYEVRYRQSRLAAMDAQTGHLDRGVAAMLARKEHGDASTYDVARIDRARQLALAERAAEASRLAEAWATLDALTLWDERPELSGELSPPPQQSPSAALAPLPQLARLELAGRALDAELAATGSPGLRGWTVGAGYRLVDDAGDTGHGFVVSLEVPLALWNTEVPRRQRLEAERTRVSSELARERVAATRGQVAAAERLRATVEAADALPPADADRPLVTMAERAYGAGEATLTELLDAYQSETNLALARIDLAWEARRAAIDLARRRGVGAE